MHMKWLLYFLDLLVHLQDFLLYFYIHLFSDFDHLAVASISRSNADDLKLHLQQISGQQAFS
jgi:hypothetical protein